MKIKKYIAHTMADALKQIRQELGPDAVILQTKEVHQGGLLNLFKKRKIEVIAALDEPAQRKQNHNDDRRSIRHDQPLIHQPNRHEQQPFQRDALHEEMLKELRYMKELIGQRNVTTPKYPPDLQYAFNYLREQEVDEGISQEIIDLLVQEMDVDQTDLKKEEVYHLLERQVKQLFNDHIEGESFNERLIHFVGPTGVGKTTTLAKIAAHLMLNKQKTVGFITTDTYRIAAVEQLKTYARILDVPIHVVYTEEEFEQAATSLANYDHILIDTAGRNFRDKKYIRELPLYSFEASKTYIVLALTAKAKDIKEIYGQFAHLPNKSIIFTKLDETTQFGSMLNVARHFDANITYLTNGQDVPDDLIIANSKKMTQYLLGGYLNE